MTVSPIPVSLYGGQRSAEGCTPMHSRRSWWSLFSPEMLCREAKGTMIILTAKTVDGTSSGNLYVCGLKRGLAKYDSWKCSISINRELVRNAYFRSRFRPTESETLWGRAQQFVSQLALKGILMPTEVWEPLWWIRRATDNETILWLILIVCLWLHPFLST